MRAGDHHERALRGKYPLVSALSRPVIAQAVAEIALELGAEAVVHGCTGKGNDQLRFELAFKAHYPGVQVIAPLRDRIWTRDEEIEYALAKGIPIVQTAASPFSVDENLFGRSIEAGVLEDPWSSPPEEPYALTSDPEDAPAPLEIVIGFEKGIPISLDGEAFGLAELIGRVNRLAGAYGIGRIDMIENRAVGIKSREVYEAPGALTLIAAHSRRGCASSRGQPGQVLLSSAGRRSSYEGRWFSPRAGTTHSRHDAELVTGESIELRRSAVVRGRSPHSIYATSSVNGRSVSAPRAKGFIRSSSLETNAFRAGAAEDRGVTTCRGGSRVPSTGRRRFLRVEDAELGRTREATAEHAAGLQRRAAHREESTSRVRCESRRIGRYLESDGTSIGNRGSSVRRTQAHAGRSRTTRGAFLCITCSIVCRGARGDRRARARGSLRRVEAETVMPGNAPAARAADHPGSPPARVGGDARPGPDALRRRGRGCLGEPARRWGARRLHARSASSTAAAAQLPRRRRRSRLRSRLSVRGCGPLHAPLTHGRGDRVVGDVGVRVRAAAGNGGDRLVDDAPEAEPGVADSFVGSRTAIG